MEDTFLLFRLIGAGSLLVTAVVLYFSLRREGWFRRILPWVGVVFGVLGLIVGGIFTYVGTTEQPIISGTDKPTRDEWERPVGTFTFRVVSTGEERSFEELRGQVVVLHLWATWCGPCVREFPELNRLQDRYVDQGLVVLTLSWEPQEQLKKFADVRDVSTLNCFVGDRTDLPDPFRRGGITMPTSYVIDRDGMLQEFVLGTRSYLQWEKKVAELL